MKTPSTGYSGTPLAKKLRIEAGTHILVIGRPHEYLRWLGELPEGVVFDVVLSSKTDIIHLFAVQRSVLQETLESLRTNIRKDAGVWVSWPKKSSKVPTDITENTIREAALPIGFVDVKVCAVSEVWSGLLLYVRKELRG